LIYIAHQHETRKYPYKTEDGKQYCAYTHSMIIKLW